MKIVVLLFQTRLDRCLDALGSASKQSKSPEMNQTGRERIKACMDEHQRHEMVKEKDQINRLIQEVERAKLLIHKPTGEDDRALVQNYDLSNHFKIDDIFYQLGAHVKLSLREKIECGEYVKLHKLLHNQKVSSENHRLQMLNKEGLAYLIPNSERDAVGINSYECWEQTFRLYAGIYSRKNPHRATKIFQHIANIWEALQTFVWESVYAYDKQFWEILSYYSNRNWGIIYYYGWIILLKSPQLKNANHGASTSGFSKSHIKKPEICWKFNKGYVCTIPVNSNTSIVIVARIIMVHISALPEMLH